MKRIAILGCQMRRDQNLCPVDAKCFVVLARKEGEFERYKNDPVSLLGIISCGGCEGNKNRPVCSLLLLKMHLSAFNENVDAIHIGTWIMNYCKRKDDLIRAVKEKAGVEVIEGTHPYSPVAIFSK